MRTVTLTWFLLLLCAAPALAARSADAATTVSSQDDGSSGSGNRDHRGSRHARTSKKKARAQDAENARSEAGLNIPEWGVAIDAFFDPRLTNLVPGYHIINIVLTNRRGSPILLSPTEDRWAVIDNSGKKHLAKNHGRALRGGVWDGLPSALKEKLSYPTAVKPGNFVTIDVFVSDDVDLSNFREIIWNSYALDKEFNIFTNYEDNISIPTAKDHPIPASDPTPGHFTEEDFMKTRDEVLNHNVPPSSQKWKDQENSRSNQEPVPVPFDPNLDDTIIIR